MANSGIIKLHSATIYKPKGSGEEEEEDSFRTEHQVKYTIHRSGEVGLSNRIVMGGGRWWLAMNQGELKTLPRVGLVWEVPHQLDLLAHTGDGGVSSLVCLLLLACLLAWHSAQVGIYEGTRRGWRQDNGNRSNRESKFDFVATRRCLVKIDEGQQKIKIVRQSTDNQIYAVPANQFSPSASTALANVW